MSEAINTMRKISDWVEKYGWTARWNHENSDGYDTFHGNTNAKPDVLLSKNGYNVAVETKPCEYHQDILNGFDQTIEYAGEYWSGRAEYYLQRNGAPIKIDGFVLATNYSSSGFLFQEEDQHGYIESDYLVKNYDMKERPITHSVIRLFWRQWEKGLAKKHYHGIRSGEASKETVLPPKPRIGALLAKIQRATNQVTNEPYLYLNSNEFAAMGYDQIYALD